MSHTATGMGRRGGSDCRSTRSEWGGWRWKRMGRGGTASWKGWGDGEKEKARSESAGGKEGRRNVCCWVEDS